MLQAQETSLEREPKLIKQEKYLRYFFNVDKGEWSEVKIITWIAIRVAVPAIVIGLGYITVIKCLPLYQSYNPSAYTSIMKAMINQSIALPPSTVCLPLSPYELDDYWQNQGDI